MSRLLKQRVVVAILASAGLPGLALADNLSLTVDPFSGAVTINNPSSSGALSLDGYEIRSASGALVPGSWNSLAVQQGAGWQAVGSTASDLAELNLASSTTIPANSSLSLGHPFTLGGVQDLTWGYTAPGGGGSEVVTNPASILYAGGLQLHVVSLLGASGNVIGTAAVLLNQESESITFDGYEVQSASGGLAPADFAGFAAHNIAGWQAIGLTSNSITELNLTSATTLAPSHDQVLGSLFGAGSTHDLTLQFHMLGGGTTIPNGVVTYSSQLIGDANGDGIVNSQDLALVSSNWLNTHVLPGDVNYDGIVNSQDLALISSNWLATTGSGLAHVSTVPEPSAFGLAAISLVTGACTLFVRRRNAGVVR